MDAERKISAEEAVRMFVESAKQQYMQSKYKMPSFKCPKCGTCNVLYADTAVLKDKELNESIEKNGYADYVIVCPKCAGYIAVRRQKGIEKSGSSFYSHDRYIFMFHTVFNNRIRGIYHCVPPENEAVFGGKYERSYTCLPLCTSFSPKDDVEYSSTEYEERKNTVYYEMTIPKKDGGADITIREYTSRLRG